MALLNTRDVISFSIFLFLFVSVVPLGTISNSKFITYRKRNPIPQKIQGTNNMFVKQLAL